jgi:hypothetical protein
MNSRRKFLIQGSLATTAMLATKPFTAIASASSSFAKLTGSHHNLIFLHTANLNPVNHDKAIQYITDIKRNNSNAILLNAGKDVQSGPGRLNYDASIDTSDNHSAITGDYKIIKKGGITTGIISAKPGETNVVQKVNDLSAYLKKEKNCKIVVCLSLLGYKNDNAPDDKTLASKSTCLDIIVCGHTDNFPAHPFIALNSNNAEVIIHSAASNSFACGKIEIDFDGEGRKKHIGFFNKLPKSPGANQAMPAA